MTVATRPADTPAQGHSADAEAKFPVGLALIAAAVIAVWAIATAVWGFNGFIGVADIVVLLTFAIILSATRQ